MLRVFEILSNLVFNNGITFVVNFTDVTQFLDLLAYNSGNCLFSVREQWFLSDLSVYNVVFLALKVGCLLIGACLY